MFESKIIYKIAFKQGNDYIYGDENMSLNDFFIMSGTLHCDLQFKKAYSKQKVL